MRFSFLSLGWYSGGALIEAVNRIKLTRPLDGPLRPLRPLRLPIHAFYKISGIGTVVVGRIQAGVVKPGMEIRIAPQPSTDELTARVKAIEMHGFPLAEAVPGDNVRLYLGNIVIKCIEQGQVLSESTVEPAKQTLSFTALVTIQNRKRPIRIGYTAIIHSNLCQSTVKFAKLISKVDDEGNEEVEPVLLKNGDRAIVEMLPSGRNMVVETYEDCPALGRFALRDTRETIGVGIIKSVDKQQQPSEDVEPTPTTTLEELNDIIKEKEREARLQKLPVRRSNVEPTVDSEAPADNVGLEMLHELVVATGCSKEMGIHSLRHTGNVSVQAATNWLREHEEDAHIDELPPAPLISKQSDAPQHSPDESVLSPPEYEESEFRTVEYDELGRVKGRNHHEAWLGGVGESFQFQADNVGDARAYAYKLFF